jgi:beta-lactam-binding protein with PASTA domain
MYVPTTVPDLVDFGTTSAVRMVKEAELVPKIMNEGRFVKSQYPRNGQSVPRGTTVQMTLTFVRP